MVVFVVRNVKMGVASDAIGGEGMRYPILFLANLQNPKVQVPQFQGS